MKYRILLLFALAFALMQGQAAVITSSVETIDFGAVEVGYPVTKSFTVSGVNMSDNISLAVTGRKSNYYEVTPTTITPEMAAGGVRVTVKCLPVSYYISPASIMLTSEGAEEVLISITVDPFYPEEMFLSGQTEEFTAMVGETVTHTGTIRFADAEIPPVDPNTPVVRSYGNGMTAIDFDATLLSPDYSISLEGADCIHFSARIVKSSFISKICTVDVSYKPRSTGSHSATLKVTCSRAGVPTVTIPLHGESDGMLCDLDGNGVLDITDLTDIIKLVLQNAGNSTRGDFDCDGVCDIDDVTKFITFLLNAQ